MPHAHTARTGNSLCEVLLALVLLAATAAWAIGATTAAERALGNAAFQRSAQHRAARALADLDALSCDTSAIARNVSEPRWLISLSTLRTGHTSRASVSLSSTARADSVQLGRTRWCD